MNKDQFFLRFNLHNSFGNFGDSPLIMKDYLDDFDASRDYLEKISSIQDERQKELSSNFYQNIEKLYDKKVLFIGDSITNDRLGYRTTVTRAAKLKGLNASISGIMTPNMVGVAIDWIAGSNPDIVSIMIGTNDANKIGYGFNKNAVSVGDYEKNLEVILDFAKQRGSKILLCEIPYICEEKFNSTNGGRRINSNENIRDYNMIVRKLAKKYADVLVFHDWILNDPNIADFFEDDGLHLSSTGHEVFAKMWLTNALKIV